MGLRGGIWGELATPEPGRFKAGDCIVCVDDTGMSTKLTLGKTYTVLKVSRCKPQVVNDIGEECVFYSKRFNKVDETPDTPLESRVKDLEDQLSRQPWYKKSWEEAEQEVKRLYSAVTTKDREISDLKAEILKLKVDLKTEKVARQKAEAKPDFFGGKIIAIDSSEFKGNARKKVNTAIQEFIMEKLNYSDTPVGYTYFPVMLTDGRRRDKYFADDIYVPDEDACLDGLYDEWMTATEFMEKYGIRVKLEPATTTKSWKKFLFGE